MQFTREDLDKIRNRDPVIFEKLYKTYKDKIFQYIYIKTKKNLQMTEDIMSETFYSAILSAPKLKSTKNLFSWFLQIANRRYYDQARKYYSEKKYIEQLPNTEINDNKNENLNGKLIKEERLLMTQIAIETLNPLYQKILKLKYIENKSQKDISKILNKSINSVESILFRARKSLKKKLEELLKD